MKRNCSKSNRDTENDSREHSESFVTFILTTKSKTMKQFSKVAQRLWQPLPISKNNQESSIHDKFCSICNRLTTHDCSKSWRISLPFIHYGRSSTDGTLISQSGWTISSRRLTPMLQKSLSRKVSEISSMPISTLRISRCPILPSLVRLLKIIWRISSLNYHSWSPSGEMVWKRDIGPKSKNWSDWSWIHIRKSNQDWPSQTLWCLCWYWWKSLKRVQHWKHAQWNVWNLGQNLVRFGSIQRRYFNCQRVRLNSGHFGLTFGQYSSHSIQCIQKAFWRPNYHMVREIKDGVWCNVRVDEMPRKLDVFAANFWLRRYFKAASSRK